MIKIALLCCYIGKLPWYFNYFVHSCKYNASIDFIIVTDDLSYNSQLPPNVKLIYKTLRELSLLATLKMGFKVDIKSSYKLCDFKPSFGLLFNDILVQYEFWGHVDVDIIFGSIRSFITDKLLLRHDLICVRHDFLTGYFLLFKNNKKMNELFKKSKDYKRVFQSAEHFCFDETNFQFEAFALGKSYDHIPSEVESMMHVVKKMQRLGYITAFFDFFVVEGRPGNLKWSKGSLFFRKRYEVLLYHMIHFKKVYKPKFVPKKIPEFFRISPNRIYF